MTSVEESIERAGSQLTQIVTAAKVLQQYLRQLDTFVLLTFEKTPSYEDTTPGDMQCSQQSLVHRAKEERHTCRQLKIYRKVRFFTSHKEGSSKIRSSHDRHSIYALLSPCTRQGFLPVTMR